MTDGARPHYTVCTFRDIDAVAPLLQVLVDQRFTTLVFQDLRWLRPWYESFRVVGVTPLIAVVTEGYEGASVENVSNVALVLTLIRRTKYLLPLVEFADRGVTDYNLPIAGPRAPQTGPDVQALMSALQKALRPFALLWLAKMPRELNGQLNPLARLEASVVPKLVAYNLPLPADGTGFLRGFGKKKRTEIERVGRALDALGENHFGTATNRRERERVLELIQQAQRVRVPRKGYRYILEQPGYRQFYEALALDPRTADVVVISAIWLADRPVAGLLGVRRDDRFIALRIGVGDEPEIMRLGLGKVLLMRTAEWAIEEKLRVFDFSIGSSSLKAWFHPETFELIDFKSTLNGLLPWRVISGVRRFAARQMARLNVLWPSRGPEYAARSIGEPCGNPRNAGSDRDSD